MKPATFRPSVIAVVVIACAGALISLGMVMLVGMTGEFSHLAQRQCLWLASDCVLAVVLGRVDYRRWRPVAGWALAVAVLLLLLVLMPGIGLRIHGARRWLDVGLFAFQPAELAKAALVLFLAAWLAPETRRGWNQWVLPLYVIVFMAGLIFIQTNRTAAFIVGAVGFRLLAQGGVPWRVMAPLYALPAAGMVWLVLARPPRFDLVERLRLALPRSISGWGFSRPHFNEGMDHTGWTGCGLGNSWARQGCGAEATTDYMAALIGEELGWSALCAMIATFVALLLVATNIARAAPDRFGRLLGLGIVALIEWQLLLHLLSSFSLLPLHAPLPFVSYGGANLCLMLAAIGVLLSIARASASRPPQPQR